MLACLAFFLLSACYCSLFVVLLYYNRSSINRNSLSTIKRRIFIALLYNGFVLISLASLAKFIDPSIDIYLVFSRLGIRSTGLLPALLLPLAATIVLFLGPLLLRLSSSTLFISIFSLITQRLASLVRPKKTRTSPTRSSSRASDDDADEWLVPRDFLEGASPKTYRKWVALRNYAVAPLAEELIYRAAVAFLLAHCLPRAVFIVLTPPLFFGAAHLHHYLELRHSGHPSRVALAAVFFQLGYTSLFGIYSNFIFLRTAHLSAAVLIHAFCNAVGMPELDALAALPRAARALVLLAFPVGLLGFALLLARTDVLAAATFDNRVY